MFILATLACTDAAETGDSATDDSAVPGDTSETGDVGLLLTMSDGSTLDLTDTAQAGVEGAPAALTIDQAGTLSVGPGTWFVQLTATAPLTIRGTTGAILSGGGTGIVIDLPGPNTPLIVEDLEITGGYGCLGSAIRSGFFEGGICARDTVVAAANDITLRGVDIHHNVYETGGGAVGVTEGSSVVVIDSNIRENDGHAVYGQMSDVSCTGSTAAHAGFWANTKYGVWVEIYDGSAHTITSDTCDFGVDAESNGYEDVAINTDLLVNYGDDATFACSSTTNTCQ